MKVTLRGSDKVWWSQICGPWSAAVWFNVWWWWCTRSLQCLRSHVVFGQCHSIRSLL